MRGDSVRRERASGGSRYRGGRSFAAHAMRSSVEGFMMQLSTRNARFYSGEANEVCKIGWERFLASIADFAETGNGTPFR